MTKQITSLSELMKQFGKFLEVNKWLKSTF
jgi:hypothetical protein